MYIDGNTLENQISKPAYFHSNVFLRVHNVEVKTVDKHRLDEKDLRYSKIRVKVVPKRGENR